jgi:hypothetical protein
LAWDDLGNPKLFRVARELVDLHGKWSPSNNCIFRLMVNKVSRAT